MEYLQNYFLILDRQSEGLDERERVTRFLITAFYALSQSNLDTFKWIRANNPLCQWHRFVNRETFVFVVISIFSLHNINDRNCSYRGSTLPRYLTSKLDNFEEIKRLSRQWHQNLITLLPFWSPKLKIIKFCIWKMKSYAKIP